MRWEGGREKFLHVSQVSSSLFLICRLASEECRKKLTLGPEEDVILKIAPSYGSAYTARRDLFAALYAHALLSEREKEKEKYRKKPIARLNACSVRLERLSIDCSNA